MKTYNVIWFDDEYDTLEILKEQATIHGINHNGFTNAEEGIIELGKNYMHYDAVIIDGLFYRKKGQSGDETNKGALVDVFRTLDNLREKKIMPAFILSGQKSYTNDVNPFAEQYTNNKVYDKLNPAHLDSLWADIKAEADSLEDTQVRHQFDDFFYCCTSLQIDSEYQHNIIDILKSVKYNYNINEMVYFAQLRKFVELIFRQAEKLGILHSVCIQKGKVNLSESSLFMAGEATKHLGVQCNKKHFPTIIAAQVKHILYCTGAAVHTEDEDVKHARMSLDELRKTINTPNLIYSLALQLMDFVIWYKHYADANIDLGKNKSYWKPAENKLSESGWIKGEVTKIAENGYGTFQSLDGDRLLTIVPGMVKGNDLKHGQIVEVTTKPDSTGTKIFIEQIRIL